MMKKKKVLYISQEITPFLPESEISTISRFLPQGIQDCGKEIRTFMPRYGCVNERRNQLHEVIRLSGMNLIIDDTDHPLIIKVASIQSARMQVYFIDNEDFFQRKFTVCDDLGVEFEDNDERAVFFARGVLETVKKLRWSPDLIHCHGWMTSFVPLYVKQSYADDPFFANAKVITSVYDNGFKNTMRDTLKSKLLFDSVTLENLDSVTNPDYVGVMKIALDYSDGVIAGSENVNGEIMDYAKQKNLKVLDYCNAESMVEAYDKFYDEVLE